MLSLASRRLCFVALYALVKIIHRSWTQQLRTQVEELLYDYNVGYLLDLSVSDGKTCMAAIRNRIGMVGVTFNEHHQDRLYERLEAQVFHDMQVADSPLYEPGLVSVVGGKKRKAAQSLVCVQRHRSHFPTIMCSSNIYITIRPRGNRRSRPRKAKGKKRLKRRIMKRTNILVLKLVLVVVVLVVRLVLGLVD